MLSEVRPLSFETELEFIPFDELRFDKTTARKLFNKIADEGEFPYENLRLQPFPIILSSKHGSGESLCVLSEHKITIHEEKPDFEIGRFKKIVKSVLEALFSIHEEPPSLLIFLQRCKIRATAQPHGSENSIQLLAGKVANVYESLNPFRRPPAFFGVRFRFPPFHGNEDEVEEEPEADELDASDDFVTLRFETYGKDISQVWLEIATMNPLKDAVDIEDSEKIIENIDRTFSFLSKQAVDFLNQFDKKSIEDTQEEE